MSENTKLSNSNENKPPKEDTSKGGSKPLNKTPAETEGSVWRQDGADKPKN